MRGDIAAFRRMATGYEAMASDYTAMADITGGLADLAERLDTLTERDVEAIDALTAEFDQLLEKERKLKRGRATLALV